MYLKTLELYGFKSFPDKTVISFTPGMTAIVGANGSGKSNLADAIRFVLGEMSAKSMRGSRLEDVIFGGTATRKSANFAEVTITIDNADHRLKYDGDEISVTRRLHRSGESEYKINGESARLKDVVETFLDTGIGREGYSLIGQGKIDHILSTKGSDRRDVFEEAAGISKFRYRKTEAQGKLESVSENAVRIADILAEVEDRLPGLEEQAKKAQAQKKLLDERKALEIALFCEQLEASDALRAELESELETANKTYRDCCDECDKLERELDRLYLVTQEENLEAEKLRAEAAQSADKQSELISTLSVLENDIHHFTTRIAEARESIRQLKEDREREAPKIESAREEMERARADAQSADEALLSRRKRTEEQERAAQSADETEKRLSEELFCVQRDLHAIALIAKEKEVFAAANRAQIELEEQHKAALTGALEAAKADERAAKEAEDRCRKAQETASATVKETGAALEEVSREILTIQRRQSAEKESLAVLSERKEALERVIRAFEGYPESVRAVMQASEAGKLSGICGPVSALISAPETYTFALEAALGAAMQHIVCEDEEAAKAAIRYLKNTRAGRATFLPLTTVDRRTEDFSDLRREAGFLSGALNVAKFEQKYLPAAEYLLGRCAITEDLDSAAAVARKRSFRVKVVTLDGQIIHSGGAFAGGEKAKSARLLSREADRKAIERELERANAKLEETKAELSRALRAEDERSRAQSAARDALEAATQALFAATGERTLAAERTAEKERALAEANEKIARLSGSESAQDAEAQQTRVRDLEEKQKSLEAELEQAEAAQRACAGELRTLRADLDEANRVFSEKIAVSAQAETAYQRLFEEDAARKAAIENMNAQIASLEQGIRDAREKISLADREKSEMGRAAESVSGRLDEIRTHQKELETETFALRAKQKERIGARETALSELQVKASKFERLNAERETYLARLAEEYELTEASLRQMKIEPGTAKSLGGKSRLSGIRSELRALGPVNEEAPEEFAALSERHRFLKEQFDDVTASKEGLENLILSLEKTMREMFLSTFEKLRRAFQSIFRDFFGGGNADIILTDPNDLLNCFIEVTVQPPGKNVKNLSLLSGGEQAFVAIALYLALLQVNPTPFCLFDEIESALDEANVARFADYIHSKANSTQFLLITHRRGTMDRADVLYGITMQEKGVSDFIRLAADEVGEEYETN